MNVYIIFSFVGPCDVVTCVDTAFLQMFLWERFGVLSSKPVEFDETEPEIVIIRHVRTEKANKYKPRGLRWGGMKPTTKRVLSKEIDVEKNYNFRPYSYIPCRVG